MSQALRNRLSRIEKISGKEYAEILQLIKQGVFYDELTDIQKEIYCRYIGIEREGIEAVETEITITEGKPADTALHFPLEYKQVVPTTEELQKIIAEVEAAALQEGRENI